MGNVALLVTTDGRRELLRETIASLAIAAPFGRFAWRVMHDDSGDDDNFDSLIKEYGARFHVIRHPSGERVGQGEAIRYVWSYLAEQAPTFDVRWVFHCEDDYLFPHPVPLAAMIELLESRPYLYQVALKRQAWFASERAAGGVMQAHPESYIERKDGAICFTEQRRHFTFNPCVYPVDLVHMTYPEGRRHERRFGERLLEQNPDGAFAYWGWVDDAPMVTHVGRERVGIGY